MSLLLTLMLQVAGSVSLQQFDFTKIANQKHAQLGEPCNFTKRCKRLEQPVYCDKSDEGGNGKDGVCRLGDPRVAIKEEEEKRRQEKRRQAEAQELIDRYNNQDDGLLRNKILKTCSEGYDEITNRWNCHSAYTQLDQFKDHFKLYEEANSDDDLRCYMYYKESKDEMPTVRLGKESELLDTTHIKFRFCKKEDFEILPAGITCSKGYEITVREDCQAIYEESRDKYNFTKFESQDESMDEEVSNSDYGVCFVHNGIVTFGKKFGNESEFQDICFKDDAQLAVKSWEEEVTGESVAPEATTQKLSHDPPSQCTFYITIDTAF